MNTNLREYEISAADFKRFSALVYQKAGINLHEGKRQLLQSRVNKVLRKRNIPSYKAYYDLIVGDPSGNELTAFIDVISTNVTHFFREIQHFDFMAGPWRDEAAMGNGPISVWSAACSSGEEPYSIAIQLSEICSAKRGFRILASDISTRILARARKAVYPLELIDKVPRPLLKKYFQKGKGGSLGMVRVKETLRQKIEFRQINLIEDFSLPGQFDIIFCRNVMIYFDLETKSRIINRFHRYLKPGAYLFIGHSESLSGFEHPFEYIEPAIYRKVR